MIRWKYAAPRLILLGAILLTVWFGLNPAVRWVILSTGQSATSAKIDVGRVETSLLRTELRLTDVAVADPRARMKNLFEADQVFLRLDADSLLRRKFVVYEGRRVSSDHVVSVDSVLYEVPRGHAGQKVILHRHVLDDDRLLVPHQGKLVELSPVDLAKNARSRRAKKNEAQKSESDEVTHPLPSSAADLEFERDLQPVVDADGGFTNPKPTQEKP